MKLFPSESIKSKITLIMVAVAGLATFFAVITFVVFDLYRFNSELDKEMNSLADVVGSNSVTAVEFKDREVADEILRSLYNNPRVIAGFIYLENGKELASFERVKVDLKPSDIESNSKKIFLQINTGHLIDQ